MSQTIKEIAIDCKETLSMSSVSLRPSAEKGFITYIRSVVEVFINRGIKKLCEMSDR